jgi:rRNA maturation endonuclease Nob1
MNPIWMATAYATVKNALRKCTHCGRKAAYPLKKPGQFHICKYCGHRFQEKKK